MIIFYDKQTGEIRGTINGRINSPEELNMWIGSKEDVGRLVIQWKPVRFYDKNGELLENFDEECLGACDENGNPLVNASDFEPDCSKDMKSLVMKMEKEKQSIKELRVDTKNKKLVKRDGGQEKEKESD